MSPIARKADLIVEQLHGETLIYDERNQQAHCLNNTVAQVWELCDGLHSMNDLAGEISNKHGVAFGEAEALVELALEQLGERHLLVSNCQQEAAYREARRELLKKLAVAAVSLPLILTLTAPKASAQASRRPV